MRTRPWILGLTTLAVLLTAGWFAAGDRFTNGLPDAILLDSPELDLADGPENAETRRAAELGSIRTTLAPTESEALSGTCSLEGRVRGPSGDAARGAHVTLTFIAASEANAAAEAQVGIAEGELVGRRYRQRNGPQRPPPVVAKVGQDGRFRFSGLPEGSYWIDANDDARSLASAQKVSVTASNAPLELSLAEGIALTGRITDDQGNPIPDVVVVVQSRAQKNAPRDPIKERSVLTDADGRFRAEGLRAKARFRLRFQSELAYHPKGFEETLAEPSAHCDAELRRYARVSGRIVDEEGNAVPAALVEYTGATPVRADGSGAFVVGQIRADDKEAVLYAGTEDLALFASTRITLSTGEIKDDVSLTVVRTGRIRGRVVDVHGQGVGGVSVAVGRAARAPGQIKMGGPGQNLVFSGWGNGGEIRLSLGGEGSDVLNLFNVADVVSVHSVPTLPVGSASVLRDLGGDVAAPLVNREYTQFETFSTNVDAEAEIPNRLVHALGALLPDESGNYGGLRLVSPSPGGLVELSSADKTTVPRVSQLMNGERSAETNELGEFEILGVRAGTHALRAQKPLWFVSPEQAPVELKDAPGAVAETEILLRRGAVVRGVIEFPKVHSAGEVRVEVRPLPKGAARTFTLKHEASVPGVLTRLQGAVEGLNEGAYEIRAYGVDQLVDYVSELFVRYEEEYDDIVISLRMGAQLKGRIADGQGRPLKDVEVKLHVLEGNRESKVAKSDEEGRYAFEGLIGGKHKLEVVSSERITPPLRELELRHHEAHREDWVLPKGVVVRGRAFGLSGLPEKGIDLFLRTAKGTETTSSGEDGRFRFEKLGPGTYILYARSKDYRFNARTDIVIVSEDETPDVDLRLAEAYEARGTLVTTSLSELAGQNITARGADNPSLTRSGKINPDGSFVIPNLYPGRYSFAVGKRVVKDVTLTVGPGEPKRTLRLTLP